MSLQQIQLLALDRKVMSIHQNMKQMLKYLHYSETSASKTFPQKKKISNALGFFCFTCAHTCACKFEREHQLSLMYHFLHHVHSPPNAEHPSSLSDNLKPATSHHFGPGVKHKSSRKISKGFGSHPCHASEQSW